MEARKRARRIVVGIVLGQAVLAFATCAQAQYANPAAAPTGPTRQISVNTNPPGVRAALDYAGFGGVHLAPYTFQASTGMHTLILDAAGYERAHIPVDAGPQNLYIGVNMSRPTFEAGIALTILGGCLLVAGIVSLGLAGADTADREEAAFNAARSNWENLASESLRYDTFEEYYSYFLDEHSWDYQTDILDDDFGIIGVALTSVGGSLLIPGILMAALDRQHDPSYNITPQ